jgi:transcriptional regulator with XRE-family HTH domain
MVRTRPPHPILTELRRARLDRGLTQEEIADRIQRPRRTVTAWELGYTQPSIEAVAEYADLFGYELVLTPKKKGRI